LDFFLRGNDGFTRESQGISDVSLVSRALAGPAYCVVAQGSYTYVGAGGALLVYDCADPDNSILVGSVHLGNRTASSMIKYLYAKDNYIYVANDFEGLWIIDVTDPTNPFKASWVVDVSDPLNPEITGSNTAIDFSAGISVEDDYVYICSPFTSSINIVNISNPSNPEFIENYILPGAGFTFNIQVQNETAFVTGDMSGIFIVDVSNPELPALLSNYIPPNWGMIDQALDVVVSEGIMYIAGFSNIYIADVFDPSNPMHLAAYAIGDGFYHTNVAISGSLLSVATQNTGLYTMDVSDPSTPFVTDNTMTGASCTDVIVNDNYAYASQTHNGTRVVDISDINDPTEVGFYGVWPDVTSYSSCFNNDELYVSGYMTSAHVLDVANPLDPVEIATWPDYSTYNTQIIDNLLYASTGNNLFYILDITDPTNPAITGEYTSTYVSDLVLTYGLEVKDYDDKRYAFVTVFCYSFSGGTEYGAVVILDVTDPTNLIEVSNIPSIRPYDVAIEGNYLYISENGVSADIPGGIKVVDITDPLNPIEHGSWSLPEARAYDIAVYENAVYLAASYAGLRVIDVSDPDDPTEVGYYDTESNMSARGITIKESGTDFPYVLVAASDDGLWILQYTGDPIGIEENNSVSSEKNIQLKCYPNPFTFNTTISYHVIKEENVSINIYNLQGQLVDILVDEHLNEGTHTINWNANDQNGNLVTDGTYLIKLQTDDTIITEKIFLVK